jgi:CBS domain-containing protein
MVRARRGFSGREVGALKARDIMNRPVVAAASTTTARDIAIQLLMGGYSGLPVTDRSGAVTGIVSELDVIRAIRAGKPLETTTAEEIMTADVISVDVAASIEDVMELLDTKHVVRVPVTEDGKLVGVISRPDVLRAFIEPKFMTYS